MLLFEPILSLINVLTNLIATLGELSTIFFTIFAECIVSLCTMEDSFQSTFSTLLFDSSKGIFRNNGIFPDSVDPTKILQAAGNALLFGLIIIELLRSMFGNYSKAESPERILGRGVIYTIAISFYHIWTNGILSLVISPIYKSFGDTVSLESTLAQSVQDFKSKVLSTADEGPLKAIADVGIGLLFSGSALIRNIILLILTLPLVIKFVTFTIEIVERYLQIFFLVLFGPLCLACGVNPNLEMVAKKWFSVWLNGMIVLCINIFFVKLSIVAVTNFISLMVGSYSSASTLTLLVKNVLVPFFATYAVMKIGSETDNIANKLGLTNLQANGLGAAMWAGGLGMIAGKIGKSFGRPNGNGENHEALNSLAKQGGITGGMAAIAAATAGKGIIGNMAATSAAIVNPAVRGAMAMDRLDMRKGTSGMFDAMSKKDNFAESLGLALAAGKAGNLNGDNSKKALGKMLGLSGGTKITSAFMKNGEITANLSNGKRIVLRPSNGENDRYGSSFRDRQGISEDRLISQDINGKTWVGYQNGSKDENETSNKRTDDVAQRAEDFSRAHDGEASLNNNTSDANTNNEQGGTPSSEEIGRWEQATSVDLKNMNLGSQMAETKAKDASKIDDKDSFLLLKVTGDEKGESTLTKVTTQNGAIERFNKNPDGTYSASETGKFFRIKGADGKDLYIHSDKFALTNKKDSHGNYIPQAFDMSNKQVLYRDKDRNVHQMKAGDPIPENFMGYCFSATGSLMTASNQNKVHISGEVKKVEVLTKSGETPETVRDKDGKKRNIKEPELDFFVNIDKKNNHNTAHSKQGHHIPCALGNNGMAIVIPPSSDSGEGPRAVAQRFDDNGLPSDTGRNIVIGYDESGERISVNAQDAANSGIVKDEGDGRYSFEVADGDLKSRFLAKRTVTTDSNGREKSTLTATANGESFEVNRRDVVSHIVSDSNNMVMLHSGDGTDTMVAESDLAANRNKIARFEKEYNEKGQEYYVLSSSGNYVHTKEDNWSVDDHLKTKPVFEEGKAPFLKVDDSQIRYEVSGAKDQYYVNDIRTDKDGYVTFGDRPATKQQFADGTPSELVTEYGQHVYVYEGNVDVNKNAGNNPAEDKSVPHESLSTGGGDKAVMVAAEGSDSTWVPERSYVYEADIYKTLNDSKFFADNNLDKISHNDFKKMDFSNQYAGEVSLPIESKDGNSGTIKFYRKDMWELTEEGNQKAKVVTLPDGKMYYAMLQKQKDDNAQYIKKLKRIIRRNGSRMSNQ